LITLSLLVQPATSSRDGESDGRFCATFSRRFFCREHARSTAVSEARRARRQSVFGMRARDRSSEGRKGKGRNRKGGDADCGSIPRCPRGIAGNDRSRLRASALTVEARGARLSERDAGIRTANARIVRIGESSNLPEIPIRAIRKRKISH